VVCVGQHILQRGRLARPIRTCTDNTMTVSHTCVASNATPSAARTQQTKAFAVGYGEAEVVHRDLGVLLPPPAHARREPGCARGSSRRDLGREHLCGRVTQHTCAVSMGSTTTPQATDGQ
jgi:hypothetical protein